jgi:hypothetical protein
MVLEIVVEKFIPYFEGEKYEIKLRKTIKKDISPYFR